MMAEAGAGGESERKNNNHNSERQGEIGEQMNWTISLGARAEGQALCKTGGMLGWRARDTEGNQGRLNRGKMGTAGVRLR